jgi:microcystin-dependent protein
MADPFLGEVKMFAGTFAPVGWNFCDGTLLAIASNDALFTLLGTTYGGDGQTTFALPDLRGRVPVHMGTLSSQSYVMGQMSGTESVTLVATHLPTHTHTLAANPALGTTNLPTGNVLSMTTDDVKLYYEGQATDAMNPGAIQPSGGSQPHENMQPYGCVNYIIATAGIYPPRS